MAQTAAAPAAGSGMELPEGQVLRTLALAVILGIVGAVAASVFLGVLTAAQDLIWTTLPNKLGLTSAPLWYVLGWVLVGTVIIAIAYRLPGHSGGSPITGLHFDIGPRQFPSVILAALGTLIFALPLGPEGPLIACGTALGALLLRKGPPPARQLAMVLTGAAAIGAIFGNPFISAFLFLEFAAMGVLPAMALIPILVSLGTGYLVETGLGNWSGLAHHALAPITGLQSLDHLDATDLVGGLVIALIVGLVVIVAREMGWRLYALAQTYRLPVLFGSAVVIAVVGVVATQWSGLPLGTTLFSGEEGIQPLVSATAVGALLIVAVGRMLTYGFALGSGFRGGPTFPAIALGVAFGAAGALIFGHQHEAPFVVAGIAAGVAASLRLPFSGGILALLLTASAGLITAPVAIIGGIVGLIIRTAADKALPPPVIPPAAAESAPEPTPA